MCPVVVVVVVVLYLLFFIVAFVILYPLVLKLFIMGMNFFSFDRIEFALDNQHELASLWSTMYVLQIFCEPKKTHFNQRRQLIVSTIHTNYSYQLPKKNAQISSCQPNKENNSTLPCLPKKNLTYLSGKSNVNEVNSLIYRISFQQIYHHFKCYYTHEAHLSSLSPSYQH